MHLKNHFKRSLLDVKKRILELVLLDSTREGFSESEFLALVVSLWKLRVAMWMKNVRDLVKK